MERNTRLSAIYNDLILPPKIKSTIDLLLEKDFQFTGIMPTPNALFTSLFNQNTEECAFVHCEDIHDPETWSVQLGHKDLKIAPPRIPIEYFALRQIH